MRLIFVHMTALLLVGCVTNRPVADSPTSSTSNDTSAPTPVARAPRVAPRDTETNPLRPSEIENLTIGEVIRLEEPNTQELYDDSRYDFPITMNARVEGWIDYFTGRGRPHMERYLARSSRYIPTMKVLLKAEGLPEDLVYLALIESGFNLRANSRARAVGPWQFMKATGQRYGLRVDAWVDERRDPIRSTVAAARYLKDLYLMFESWYLAASAYNAGEYKILRAIDQLKTNNYWRICQTKFLRRETKDYIPKLIAAAIIAKNSGKYGFSEIEYADPLEFDTVTVDFTLGLKDVAQAIDTPLDDLEELNPELRRSMVPPTALPYDLRVPSGTKTLSDRALASMRTRAGAVAMPAQHIVKAGDTLASLSRQYQIRVRDLANANNLGPREKLSVGTALLIPKGAILARSPSSRSPKRQVDESGEFVTHVVQRGESLWSIAEVYNVTVQDLFRWNGLRRSRINAGATIRIRKS